MDRIDNAQFPCWWRNSDEVFAVIFEVKNSVVTRKSTGFGIEGAGIDEFSPSAVGFAEVEHWRQDKPTEPVQAGWTTSDRFRHYRFSLRMTPKATAMDRRRFAA